MRKNRKITIFSLALLVLGTLTLTSCDTSGLDELNNIQSKLFPNIWAFITQFIVFLVMVAAVIFLLYKPTKKYLNSRKEAMQKEIDEANSTLIESKKNLDESRKIVANSRKEASKILEQTEQVAKENEKKNKEILDKELIELRQQAEAQLQKDKEKARAELSKDVVDLALGISSKVLEREVNEDDNKKIIDSFVDNLKDK